MFIAPVRVATTSDTVLSGVQTIDGVSAIAGDRVLVKDQTDASQNGVYVVAAAAWSRATDFDEPSEVVQGASVLVIEGATQADSAWALMTPNPIDVGVTPLEWRSFPDLSAYVTKTGAETLSNKAFEGSVAFTLDGGRIGITSGDSAFVPEAVAHVINDNSAGVGLLVESHWEGSAGTPYINNDCTLFQVYSKLLSDSANRSWAASLSNNYRDIPVGMTDSGEHIGGIGWAGSVALPGFVHAGTLWSQVGIKGTAGFQGGGSPATAVVQEANGVQGVIYADSSGATINTARAGAFASDGGPGVIQTNIGVFSRATNGTVANYSFYGDGGKLFNSGAAFIQGRLCAGSEYSESGSAVAARKTGNSLEFGYPDVGYGSNVGATQSTGRPFLAFLAETDPTGDTFRTRGKKGVVISSDLAGSLVFSRLTDPNASGQNLIESAKIDATGSLIVAGALSAASLTLTAKLPVAQGGTGASSASVARTNLGLGTAAVKNTGTSGDAIPLLNGGATTWASGMTLGGGLLATGQIAAGVAFTQSSSSIVARKAGNSLEFGHPNPAGYGCNLGATPSLGLPFLALCAEADATGNTFTTRGKKGVVVSSDLAGALVFSRLTNPSASGQSPTESARLDPNGHLVLSETPVLKQGTPSSSTATGIAGEVCWDASYLYICVATNVWKRVGLSTW